MCVAWSDQAAVERRTGFVQRGLGVRRRLRIAVLGFMLVVAGVCVVPVSQATAKPAFKMPFACGDSQWFAQTRAGHEQNVYALDLNKPGDGDVGVPVRASAGGTIKNPAYPSKSGSNPVAIAHDSTKNQNVGWATVYLHMRDALPDNTPVKQGDIIGYVSNVGAPGGRNHLHYEQRDNRIAQPVSFTNWTAEYSSGSAIYAEPLGVQLPPSDNGCGKPLSECNDNFNAQALDPQRWEQFANANGPVAVRSQRLVIGPVRAGSGGSGVRNRCTLTGDFDVRVDFSLLGWPSTGDYSARLSAPGLGGGPGGTIGISRSGGPNGVFRLVAQDRDATIPSSDLSGVLRLVRQGSTVYGYVMTSPQSGWTFVGNGSVPTGQTFLAIDVGTSDVSAPGTARAAFDNFAILSGTAS